MAEPFNIIGLCLGCLSLTLSTIPAGMKFFDNFRTNDLHYGEFKTRVAVCQSRFSAMEMNWRGYFDDSGDASHLDDVETFAETLKLEITRYLERSETPITWPKIRDRLMHGSHESLRLELPYLCHRIMSALWKNDVLEKSITTLEKALNTNDEDFKQFYYRQTGEEAASGPRPEKVEELKKIDSYFKTLWRLGDELYAECTRINCKSAWALELVYLEAIEDVANWYNEPPVVIHIRNLEVFGADGTTFLAELEYVHDDDSTHRSGERIIKIFEERVKRRDASDRHENPEVMLPQITRSMGHLLEESSPIFHDLRWKLDLIRLIHAICNWSILFWRTKWFECLCCFEIVFDVASDAPSGLHFTKPVLKQRTSHSHCCIRWEDHGSRLKNLGMALAQLLLGRRIRPLKYDQYTQLVGDQWKPTTRTKIVWDIGKNTVDTALQSAITYCLEPRSTSLPILQDEVPPAYMQKCIKEVYKPICAWCYKELPEVQRAVASLLGSWDRPNNTNTGWPREAFP